MAFSGVLRPFGRKGADSGDAEVPSVLACSSRLSLVPLPRLWWTQETTQNRGYGRGEEAAACGLEEAVERQYELGAAGGEVVNTGEGLEEKVNA